jgi:hypothetical protein
MIVSEDPALGSTPTPREAGQILFRSFLLSQGSAELQRNLFSYVALAYPSWCLTQQERAAIAAEALPPCTRYVASGLHIPVLEASIRRELRRQSLQLMRALERGPADREALLVQILRAVIGCDYGQLQKEKGRPRAPRRDHRAQTLTEPYFSHFCHFGLLHRPTGLPVFDHLFAELVSVFTRRFSALAALGLQDEQRYQRYQLKIILELQNRHYPRMPLSALC